MNTHPGTDLSDERIVEDLQPRASNLLRDIGTRQQEIST